MATLTELSTTLNSLNSQLLAQLKVYNTKTHLGRGYFLYTKIALTNNAITPFTYGLTSAKSSLDINNIPKIVLKRYAQAIQRLLDWTKDLSANFPTFNDLEQP